MNQLSGELKLECSLSLIVSLILFCWKTGKSYTFSAISMKKCWILIAFSLRKLEKRKKEVPELLRMDSLLLNNFILSYSECFNSQSNDNKSSINLLYQLIINLST